MPVIDRRGQPLPPDHPFSGNKIIFGMRPPEAFLQRLRQAEKEAQSHPAEVSGNADVVHQQQEEKKDG